MRDPFADQLVVVRPWLMGFAMRLTGNDHAASEDLVSETMIKALHYRDRFDLDTSMRAWTTFILRNQFLTQVRRRKWNGGSTDALPVDLLPGRMGSQEAAVNLADTLKVLQLLPRDQREAMLQVGAGASYEEAAEDLHCAVGTIKSRVARGRAALTEMMA